MKTIIQKVVGLIILVGLILGLAVFGASKPAKQTVKIAYLPLTHALPLFVEEELNKDQFKNLNLELVKFGSWPELMDALNAGKVDGASVLIELGVKAKEQGIGLKAVALGHRDGNVVVVANDINSAADLKGKTFAIPHRLSTHNLLLSIMLKKAGLSYNDLKVIELPPPEMPAALAEKRIAGYIVAEPFGAKAVASGFGKVLYQSQDLWRNSICCALLLQDEFIKNNRSAAREFVADYAKAGDYLSSGGVKAQEIAQQYLRVEDNVLKLSLKWISFNNLRINEGDYKELIKNMKELNLISNPPSYKEFVDNSL
ncbi:MAG TPA: ABC transporter substrate-binding protein [Bacillota bacterium]|nr:ABC transporter substrate-binding protein [Bacillota bacterium]